MDAWNDDPESEAKTVNRLKSFEMMTKSDSASNLESPAGLTSMKKCLAFHERVINFLSSKMGAAQTSLAYVLRAKNLKLVTDKDRLGTVDSGKSHMYETWADYGTRCTVLEGKHFETDNAQVW